MSERPLFSIITVTRNAQSTLEPTLESVDAQDCDLYEHLIMDGASTDETLDIASRYLSPRRIVRSAPDRGIYDAMNRGMEHAKGEYLIFLNAGDTFHSSRTLSHLADAIMDTDFPGVIYGQTEIVDGPERRRLGPRHLEAPEVLTLDSFREGMVVCHQAFVALRKLADVYDLQYRYSSDFDWCIRVLQHSRRNTYIPEVLIDYLREGTTTRHHRRSLWERFSIMCKYYGVSSTVARHFGFIPRYLKRRAASQTSN